LSRMSFWPTENRKVTGSTPVGATVPFPGFYWERDFFCPARRFRETVSDHSRSFKARALRSERS
jgi:hypothetical protein